MYKISQHSTHPEKKNIYPNAPHEGQQGLKGAAYVNLPSAATKMWWKQTTASWGQQRQVLLSIESGEHLGKIAVLSVYVIVFVFSISDAWSRGEGWEGEEQEKEDREDNRGHDRGTSAQVLLLMDPGAEPGWAVLSDTLPSAGEEKKTHFNQKQCF